MSTNIEAGYFFLELNEIILSYSTPLAKELKVRIDAEIINGKGIVLWDDKTSVYKTGIITAFEQEISLQPENGESLLGKKYTLGFNKNTARAAYIDLKNDSISTLASATLHIKIINIDDNPPPAAPAASIPSKKGAPTPVAPTEPAEDILFVIDLPISNLLKSKGSQFQTSKTFKEIVKSDIITLNVKNKFIIDDQSLFSWKVSADNDLAEYAMGCSIMQFTDATFDNLPLSWSLHYNDVIDPKAKIPPTATDLRNRYLENIHKLVETQDKVCKYFIENGGDSSAPPPSVNADGEVEETDGIQFPQFSFGGGEIQFNSALAATVPIDENIRTRSDLWKVAWAKSSPIFFHRSYKRKLLEKISSNPSSAQVSIKLLRTPTPEAAALEGAPSSIDGVLDISSLIIPGKTSTDLTLSIINPSAEGANSGNPSIVFAVTISEPLKALVSVAENTKMRPADVVSTKQVSAYDSNRDVLKELQAEITSAVKQIANEYIVKYPHPPASTTAAASHAPPLTSIVTTAIQQQQQQQPMTLADRKAEFLYYLSTSGVYHIMKENLKPRIQRVACERFGARSKAMNKSSFINQRDTKLALHETVAMSNVEEDKVDTSDLDGLLAELYVFLVQECNMVLNSMYTTTLIDRDTKELNITRCIDDEVETPTQKLSRLLLQALDAECDGRYVISEQIHLERMQLTQTIANLAANTTIQFDNYARYGEYCLRQANRFANLKLLPRDDQISYARSLMEKGREALTMTFSKKPEDLHTSILYAALLIEAGQFETAGTVLHTLLRALLHQKGDNQGLKSFNDFSGYDSDALIPVDPLYYVTLAVYFSITNQPLKTRKSLILANRSYIEKGCKPLASNHGIPRRTLVLCLSQASIFFSEFGLSKTSTVCCELSISCEDAVTAKANSRRLPAATVPFIRHIYKRGQAAAAMTSTCFRDISIDYNSTEGGGQEDSSSSSIEIRRDRLCKALDLANDSVLCAVDRVDQINGWLYVAKCQIALSADSACILDAYISAISIAVPPPESTDTDLTYNIPVECFIHTGKLFINSVRFKEGYSTIISACRTYISSSLLLLLGICSIRLSRYMDAEDALKEANLLDNRNPDVWAYLSLLCLTNGSNRYEEAEKCLRQSLRLGLNNSVLLRELATTYMSIDKLSTAEEIIRRAISQEIASSNLNKANPVTRKLFADVLAGQNQAVLAVEEYQSIIADEDSSMKLAAAKACLPLLHSLGRYEELKTLRKIIDTLKD